VKHITSKNISCSAATIALGNFDGLHLGHQALIRECARVGGTVAVFSFAPHPSSVLAGVPFKTILTSEEKALLLEKMGVDLFIEYPFDEEIANMPPERFVGDILAGQLNASSVAVGEDYRFGKGGRGDCELLCELGGRFGFAVKIIPHVTDNGSKISSSRVREAVTEKDFGEAHRLMGRSYFVMGEVVRGNLIGRGIGVPTANLVPDAYKLLPPPGVYRSQVLLEGESFTGMTNIGTRPTVTKSDDIVVETHLLDFDDDIYGKIITVEFCEWIRQEKRFNSLDELREQLMKDILAVRDKA